MAKPLPKPSPQKANRALLKKAKHHGKKVPKHLVPTAPRDASIRKAKRIQGKKGMTPDIMPDGVTTRGGGEDQKQKMDRFLDFYFQGFNKVQSARLAGYADPVHAAYRLTHEVKYIVERIETYQKEIEEKYRITRERAIEGFIEAIDMARTQANPDAMIKGWKEICGVMGHYAPKTTNVKITEHKTKLLKVISRLSDEELLAKIGGEHGLLIDGTTGEAVDDEDDAEN